MSLLQNGIKWFKTPSWSLLMEIPLILFFASMPVSISFMSISMTVFYAGAVLFFILKRKLIVWSSLYKEPAIILFGIFFLWLWLSWLLRGGSNEELTPLMRMMVVMYLLPFLFISAPFIRWAPIVLGFLLGLIVSVGFGGVSFFIGLPEWSWLPGKVHEPLMRNGGLLPDPPYLAGLLIFGFYIVLGGSVWVAYRFHPTKKTYQSWAIVFLMMMILLGVVVTQTRGLWLALVISGIIFILAQMKQLIKIRRYVALFLILLFYLVFIIFYHDPHGSLSRLTPKEEYSDLLDNSRFQLYQLGIDIGLDHWMVGSGHFTYESVFEAQKVDLKLAKIVAWHAHNDLIQLWVINGIVFALLFVLIVLRIGYGLIRQYIRLTNYASKLITLALFGALFGLFLYGLTDYIIFGAVTGSLYWALLGIMTYIANTQRNDQLFP